MKDLSESIWGGILDRGAGETIRKEDDVNLLDLDGLYDYIKSRYEKRLFYLDKDTFGRNNKRNIVVDVIANISLFTNYDKSGKFDHILLSWTKVKIGMPFFDKLKERFNVQMPNVNRRTIPEKDGTCTNQTYIDVIDFFLDNIDNMLVNESVWGGILDRGTGDSERKEDDVNLLDLNGLCDYLNSVYKSTTPGQDILVQNFEDYGDCLVVCLYEDESGYYRYLYYNGSYITIQYDVFEIIFNGCLSEIRQKYSLEKTVNGFGVEEMNIYPKDKARVPVTNKFFIEVLDFILDKIDVPLNQQIEKINESVWGDVLDRGVGEVERKEDFDLETEEKIKTVDFDLFSNDIVFMENVDNSIDGFKQFVENNRFLGRYCAVDWKTKKVWRDIVVEFVEKYWEKRNYSKCVDEFISKKEKEISKMGFEKVPGKSIYDTVNDWWNNLNSDDKYDVLLGCGIEDDSKFEKYSDDELWEDLDYFEQMNAYMVNNKTTNESVWGDVLDRGAGDTKRKEDEIPQDLQKPLAAYIDMFASNAFSGNYTVGSYPDFRAFVKDFMNSPRIMKLDFDMGDLLDYITQDHYYDIIHPVIMDTIDKINKSVNVAVDTIIDSLKNPKMNESVWSDILDRGVGETVRKEDDLTPDDVKYHMREFVGRIVYYSQYENTVNDYERFSKERWRFFDDKSKAYTKKQIDYVKRNWEKGEKFRFVIEDFIKNEEEKIKKLGFEREPGKSVDETLDDWWDSVDNKWDFMDDCDEECYTNPDDMWDDRDWEEKIKMYMDDKKYMGESVWGGILDRGTGSETRKEEEVLTDNEINSLNEFTLMYCREERAHYIQNHIVPPPPSRRKENDYEGLIKYIEDRRDENLFTNVGDYNKIIRYIKKNWDRLDMDTYIKKWICSPSVMKGTKIVECEGVPGGATPANVGGMGAAYFPGPNGEPGSGDLPSPTGIVYHQVAPYTMFLKQTKKKKKKAKKFRKEDEPCVHSPNAKVYDYVDDFREYVDRTYNQMDRR